MAREAEEDEREFLAGLKARTGRDLAQWMAAIAAQGFADKNEVIDWLREQGLPFARASWLERIHKNGGKPIYASNLPAAPSPQAAQPPSAPQPPPVPAATASPAPQRPAPDRPAPVTAEVAAPDADAMEKLIAAAKGYRPLYHLLAAAVLKAIPDLTIAPRSTYLSMAAPAEFAAITLHATELRLGLDLGDRPFDGELQKSKLRGPGAAITHMLVLTDARQVNDDLMSLIKAAQQRVNA
jgi:Domain of unknown function (DUF5655)